MLLEYCTAGSGHDINIVSIKRSLELGQARDHFRNRDIQEKEVLHFDRFASACLFVAIH